MTQEKIEERREELREKLDAYIRAEGQAPRDQRTACPRPGCGGTVVLDNQLVGEGLYARRHWRCCRCGAGGDTVDYALARWPNMTESEAIRHVQRMLHIKVTDLEAVSAGELLAMKLPRRHWRVEQLLGPGLYILSGPSKAGKSWLVLYLAERVSRGERVWDMRSSRCAVLYISLEDTLVRLQQRLLAVTDGEPGEVYLATEAELLGSGFEEQIENFLSTHGNTGLVIIDTLQMIRQPGAEKYSYAGDYATMSALKRLADRHGITVLLVHHTRKMAADDPMDMLSGTTGIAGAADGSLVLQRRRGAAEATLTVMGRDAPDQQLHLRFDAATKRWALLDRGEDDPADEDAALCRELEELTDACGGWEGTASELAQALESTEAPTLLGRRLQRLRERLRREHGLKLESFRSCERRSFRLTRMTDDV